MIPSIEVSTYHKAYRLPRELCWRFYDDVNTLKDKIINELNSRWTEDELKKYPNRKITDVYLYEYFSSPFCF